MANKMFRRAILLFLILSYIFVGVAFAEEKDANGKLVGAKMFNEKCSKCHGLDRPNGKKKTNSEWTATLTRMRSKDPEWLSESNVKEIGWFLSSKSLFETKCSQCHGIDRPLGRTKSKEDWTITVRRMRAKHQMTDKNWISDAEEQQIIDYLFTERGL